MSHAHEPSSAQAGIDEHELAPTQTEGYKVTELKSTDQYAQLDANDESLARWKASLGIDAAAGAGSSTGGPRVQVLSLSLISDSRKEGAVVIDVNHKEALARLKKDPVRIKEGAEYAVELAFKVNDLITGLKYIQVAKRMGATVDKMEEMIGSYSASKEVIKRRFATEEAPSGMLARGSYNVRSRVIDDDGRVYADFEWQFKLSKDW